MSALETRQRAEEEDRRIFLEAQAERQKSETQDRQLLRELLTEQAERFRSLVATGGRRGPEAEGFREGHQEASRDREVLSSRDAED